MTEETERAREVDAAVKKADAKKAADAAKAAADAARADEDYVGQKLDVLLSHLDALSKRMDAYDEMDKERGFEKQQLNDSDSDSDGDDGEDPEKPRPSGVDSRKRKDMMDSRTADARADAEELEAYRAETNQQHAQDSSVLHSIQWAANRASDSWGRDAVQPWDGESISGYRRRVAHEHKEHSPQWKGVDLGQLHGQTLRNAVAQIFADSIAASRSSTTACAQGFLREVRRRDPDTGHLIREFYGEPRSWMQWFAGGSPRLARFRFDQKDRV